MKINVENPLLSDGNMRRIIECYFKTNSLEQFSTSIKNHISFKNYEETSSEKYAVNTFINLLFDYWKNQIINCNIDNFPYTKYKINESDLLYLKSFLIKNEITNYSEYSINNVQNKRLYEIFGKFNYLNSGVEYKNINSYDFYIDQKIDIENEYIITLNIKSRALLFKLLTHYIKICLDNKRTFNFKFSETLNNDNTVIIYADKNNIEKIIQTLIEIRKNNKELDAELQDVAKEPPLLYGVVDDWIGVRQIDDNYYDNRINCLYESINLVVSNWYDNEFKNRMSQYINMTYKDVLEEEIRSYFNYELNYLCLNSVKDYFTRKKMDKFIGTILDTKYNDLNEFIFHVPFNNDIKITKNDINRRIYKLIGDIYRNDKEFVDDIRNSIVMYSNKYNIDSKKFFLDKDASNILHNLYDNTDYLEIDDYLLEFEQPKEKVLNRKY